MVRAFFNADGKGIALSTLNGGEGYSALVELLKASSSAAVSASAPPHESAGLAVAAAAPSRPGTTGGSLSAAS